MERPIHADTAITMAIMPMSTLRPFDLAMHLSAFLIIYIEKFSKSSFMHTFYHTVLKTD